MTTDDKALALVNEVRREYPNAADYTANQIALCRAIKQHEAFRQEVSDAVHDYFRPYDSPLVFQRFIISKPKPDPLINVAKMLGYYNTAAKHLAGDIRAALDAAGFEIREKNDDPAPVPVR